MGILTPRKVKSLAQGATTNNPLAEPEFKLSPPTSKPPDIFSRAARGSTYQQMAEGTAGWALGEFLSFLCIEGVGRADI